MKGRVYFYLPTNKQYNYPKVEGLLYNTKEKRFSFPVDLDAQGKVSGDIIGKAIRDFQSVNPGVKIVKVETKPLANSVPVNPVTTNPKPVVTVPAPPEEDSSNGILLVVAALAALYFL